MDVTFDPRTNATNFRKHGVLLSEGDGVLRDPWALTVEDVDAEGEQLRVVVFAYREDGVRIISVRKPERKEVRAYEKGC